VAERDGQIDVLTAQLDQVRGELRERDSSLSRATGAQQAEITALNSRLAALLSSTSWKVTAPLRGLKRIVSRH
jgi:hypothetical protein